LKIDRAFIRDLPDNNDDKAIASAIIGLGKALGVTTVAEGVETVGQQTFLRDHSCDEMQGYLFSRPLPAEEMGVLLQTFAAAAPPLLPWDMNPAEQPRVRGQNQRGHRQPDRQSVRRSRNSRLKSAP
jgi:predicted signal transduction protein with EAL and GGDEF domain